MSGYIPDGQRCIICGSKASNGRIVHRPAPYCIYPATAAHSGGMAVTGAVVADGQGPARYMLFVSRLETTRRQNRYICPACGAGIDDPGKGLKVDPGPNGPLFVCHDARRGGGDLKTHAREILDAVGLTWADILPERYPVFTIDETDMAAARERVVARMRQAVGAR